MWIPVFFLFSTPVYFWVDSFVKKRKEKKEREKHPSATDCKELTLEATRSSLAPSRNWHPSHRPPPPPTREKHPSAIGGKELTPEATRSSLAPPRNWYQSHRPPPPKLHIADASSFTLPSSLDNAAQPLSLLCHQPVLWQSASPTVHTWGYLIQPKPSNPGGSVHD
jgi:hypothetical protein